MTILYFSRKRKPIVNINIHYYKHMLIIGIIVICDIGVSMYLDIIRALICNHMPQFYDL